MKTKEMEYALFNYFSGQFPLITTNITYLKDFVYHECDILMASKANILTEIEIKVSKSDFKADFKKEHGHSSPGIKYQYFAFPNDIIDDEIIDLIPKHFGILICHKTKHTETYMRKIPIERTSYYVRIKRKPKTSPYYNKTKLSDKDLINLYRLSGFRYWTGKLRELKHEGLYLERKIK